MGTGTIRTTSQHLRARLGEPADVDIKSSIATVMRYAWRWSCGCRAEGSAESAVCAPCARHVASLPLD